MTLADDAHPFARKLYISTYKEYALGVAILRKAVVCRDKGDKEGVDTYAKELALAQTHTYAMLLAAEACRMEVKLEPKDRIEETYLRFINPDCVV